MCTSTYTQRANGLKCIKLCLVPIFFLHFNFFFHLDNPSTLLYPECVCVCHTDICLKTIVVTKAILLSCYNVFCEYLFVICSLYLLCRALNGTDNVHSVCGDGKCTVKCMRKWDKKTHNEHTEQGIYFEQNRLRESNICHSFLLSSALRVCVRRKCSGWFNTWWIRQATSLERQKDFAFIHHWSNFLHLLSISCHIDKTRFHLVCDIGGRLHCVCTSKNKNNICLTGPFKYPMHGLSQFVLFFHLLVSL